MYLKLATLADSSAYDRLAKLFYLESPFSPQVEYNETKTHQLLELAVSSQHKDVLVLLLVDDDQAVGMLVGFATTTPFSDDKIASELAWYIEPSFRGSRKAVDLVLAYETWARTVGCKHVSMSLLNDLTDVSKFYEKLGYKRTEISYIKEL